MLLSPNPRTPVSNIRERITNSTTIKGSPVELLTYCESNGSEEAYRIWTFQTPIKPPDEMFTDIMEEFLDILKYHRPKGQYESAWWQVEDPDSENYVFEALFVDKNPVTAASFFDRAGDGPRIAMFYGKRFEIMEATKSDPEDEMPPTEGSAFVDRAIAHLASYKENKLGIKKPGIFYYRGQPIPKEHILPKEDFNRNILEPYRSDFFAFQGRENIKLHRYFHHLNSSQALCFNLFFPLIKEGQLGKFLNQAGIQLGESLSGQFEKQSEIEKNAKRLTSFDFYLKDKDLNEVFVEVKYSEVGFGKAQRTKEEDKLKYQKKFGETYKPLFDRIADLIYPDYLKEDKFLDNYQLMRNLVHMADNAYVILLFPSANEAVLGEAKEAAEEILTKEGRERFRIVHLEKLISALKSQFEGQPLGRYYEELEEKYCF